MDVYLLDNEISPYLLYRCIVRVLKITLSYAILAILFVHFVPNFWVKVIGWVFISVLDMYCVLCSILKIIIFWAVDLKSYHLKDNKLYVNNVETNKEMFHEYMTQDTYKSILNRRSKR